MRLSDGRIAALAAVLATCVPAMAAPLVSGIGGDTSQGGTVIISGSSFGSQGGSVLVWDDFEAQTLGQTVSGCHPVIGPNWTALHGGTGNLGVRWDDTHVHAGSVACHVDWGYDGGNTQRAIISEFGNQPQIYVSYWRHMEGNYTTSNPTCNHKQFYLFGTVNNMPQGMPLMPAGTTGWGFYNNVSEFQPDWDGTNNINTQGWTWSNTEDVYQRWEFWCKLNDPYTAYNGVLTYWKDGVVGCHREDYRHRFVDGVYHQIMIGNMAQEFTDTAKAWFDDICLASTQARVELGNNSNWNNCTHREIQIPSSWSSSSITVDFNQGSFPGSTQVYLFVVDADGNASSGYAVTTD
jgi:hypothetical protein